MKYCSNQIRTFADGIVYMTQHDLWGGGGGAFAASAEYASLSFGLFTTSLDGMVASLDPKPANGFLELMSTVSDPFVIEVQEGRFFDLDKDAYQYMWNNRIVR